MRVPKKWIEKDRIFKELIFENFTSLMKNLNIDTQKAQQCLLE